MVRTIAWITFIGFVTTSLAATADAVDSPAVRPNVLFVLVDDLGYGDISAFRELGATSEHGPSADRLAEMRRTPATPHIDALAARGLRLTNFYVASPICSPSRVGCTTGQYPARHLINSYLNSREQNRARGMRDFLSPDVATIARTFQNAGYSTAHFGKWHMGGGRDVDDAPHPKAYGFEESLVSFEGLGDRILPPGGLAKQSEQLGQGTITWVEKHEQTPIYVDRCIDFMTRHKDDPFYLQLWLNDVHDGHAPAAGEAEKFADVTSNPNEQKFFAVLTEMDRQLGRLFSKLDELGIADRTIVVLTSDNGPTAWPNYYSRGANPAGSTAGFRGRKWSLYEGGIRMPLIVRWPGHVPANEVNGTTIIGAVDLFPTLAALAGIDTTSALKQQGIDATPSHYFDGQDLSAALLGREKQRTRPLLWEYGRDESYLRPGLPLDQSPNLAIRDGQWKLLVNADGTRLELYDLSQSTSEFENVAGRHPGVAQMLKQQLLDWRNSLPVLDVEAERANDQLTPRKIATRHDYRAGDAIPTDSAPRIASAPFSVTAEFQSNGGEGVIVAQGGSAAGYALYVQNGKLKFTTRVRGQETTFETDAPPDGRLVKVTAACLGDGSLRMHIGQDLPLVVKGPSTIPNMPGDGLEVGRDRKSPVGNYETPFAYAGEIRRVTVAVGQSAGAGPPPTLVTRFAADVDPQHPLPEYPRPQFVRDQWLNLNGYWDYAIRPGRQVDAAMDLAHLNMLAPEKWDGRIVVPFCVESALSQVQRRVGEDNVLWYRRRFTIPADWNAADVQLNFGAIDWEAQVWVNGTPLSDAPHRGGYDPFSYRIGKLLKPGENELLVRVWDPTDTRSQPRGKQIGNPHGIWYTPVTGIWQTVWLEPLPARSISQLRVTPNVSDEQVRLELQIAGADGAPIVGEVHLVIRDGETVVSNGTAVLANGRGSAQVPLANPHLWTPDDPHLYDLELTVDGEDGDHVRSYFGMRSIAIGEGPNGFQRMLLNGKSLFQYGPLDQGWWPDGLYTAPTDEALRYDIEVTKQLGFNMARKHVKVEPARWYYHCDKLGLLVWQDLPSAMATGKDQQVHPGEPHDRTFTPEDHAQWLLELRRMIDNLWNAPSIVVWCPLNEGWGQHQTTEILNWTMEYDHSRLTDGVSGWEDRGVGHLKDMHKYPGPGMFPVMPDRVSVLGEFGGLGLPLPGHIWVNNNNWGYRTYQTTEELRENYDRLLAQMPSLIAQGLAAAVYTQTTDVEVEVNGLMTYDRQIIKFDREHLHKLHRRLYGPPPRLSSVLSTSERSGQPWSYTTTAPEGDGWAGPAFDASAWKTGPGGFGTENTPNTFVRTVWDTADIWLRREFIVDQLADGENTEYILRIYHDEDAEVFLNGERVATFAGFVDNYVEVPVDRRGLTPGKNVIAIHCHQTTGGQYIDAGLMELRTAAATDPD
ncbi:MAG: sulfatase-like hydrolase/transferase [Planctomycetaceae bacterium]